MTINWRMFILVGLILMSSQIHGTENNKKGDDGALTDWMKKIKVTQKYNILLDPKRFIPDHKQSQPQVHGMETEEGNGTNEMNLSPIEKLQKHIYTMILSYLSDRFVRVQGYLPLMYTEKYIYYFLSRNLVVVYLRMNQIFNPLKFLYNIAREALIKNKNWNIETDFTKFPASMDFIFKVEDKDWVYQIKDVSIEKEEDKPLVLRFYEREVTIRFWVKDELMQVVFSNSDSYSDSPWVVCDKISRFTWTIRTQESIQEEILQLYPRKYSYNTARGALTIKNNRNIETDLTKFPVPVYFVFQIIKDKEWVYHIKEVIIEENMDLTLRFSNEEAIIRFYINDGIVQIVSFNRLIPSDTHRVVSDVISRFTWVIRLSRNQKSKEDSLFSFISTDKTDSN